MPARAQRTAARALVSVPVEKWRDFPSRADLRSSFMSTLLSARRSGPRRLRELLATPELIVAPGAYDCLSARLIEAAGFPAVYMTGFGTAAAYLGRPDVGLLGMSEMVDNARRIVD